jgi:hypothetical protein
MQQPRPSLNDLAEVKRVLLHIEHELGAVQLPGPARAGEESSVTRGRCQMTWCRIQEALYELV